MRQQLWFNFAMKRDNYSKILPVTERLYGALVMISASHPVTRGSNLVPGIRIFFYFFFRIFYFISFIYILISFSWSLPKCLLATRSVNHGLFGVGKQPKERDLIIMFIDFLKHGWQVWPQSQSNAQKWDKPGNFFSYQMSVHSGSESKYVPKSDLLKKKEPF